MPRLDPETWVRAASDAIARRGVDGVKVEVLAQELGVSKGSFYWHFDNRGALLAAVLAAWEAAGTSAIIAYVEDTTGGPPERLWRLMMHTFRAELPHGNFELHVRAWAQSDATAEAVVRRVDRRRLGYVTGILVEAGLAKPEAKRRANLLYRTLIGELSLRAYGATALPEASLKLLWTALLKP